MYMNELTQQQLASDELLRLGDDLAARLPEVPPAPSWYEQPSA
jgi:hypothetical protein